ncbi:MAG: NUDIX hydrolase [Oscillatoriales cyanobacterium RM2_1_1]|nr:NUDIX hydrolase [Oscillatoriales cyanobacterium SM2_3_0]NJO45460.1 NUDIX hydrolase [Oscillatoriales cyanobacterium RM2_1_1]
MEPDWIRWGRALQAIAQTGLHFTQNPYDVERYEQIRDLASEMFAAHSNSQPEVILDLFSQETGYATPKVDVRGVVFREGKILLVQEVLDQNRWTLPGGWADVNETPSQATIREIFEESGFETKVIKLLAVYDRAQQGHKPLMPYHVYKLFFLCEIVSGQATPSHETSGIAFFGENEIPELSISRVLPQQIQRFFHHASHFDWPTEFD